MARITKETAKSMGSKGGKKTVINRGILHMRNIAAKGGSSVDKSYWTSEASGDKMYKCKVCGAVGNWEEFVASGACHKGRRPKIQ